MKKNRFQNAAASFISAAAINAVDGPEDAPKSPTKGLPLPGKDNQTKTTKTAPEIVAKENPKSKSAPLPAQTNETDQDAKPTKKTKSVKRRGAKKNMDIAIINGIETYSVEETARRLNVTPRTIMNYLKFKKINGQKIGGKWRISKNNLTDYINGME